MKFKDMFKQNKKKPNLTLVKPPLPDLTFDAIKEELFLSLPHDTKGFEVVEGIYKTYSSPYEGKCVPTIILVHPETSELKYYALLGLIKDLTKRFGDI